MMKEIVMFNVRRVAGLVQASLVGVGLATSPQWTAFAASPPTSTTPTASRSAPTAPTASAPAASSASVVKQEDFDTPDAAAAALLKANQDNDVAALRAIFGPSGEKLVVSGDAVADRAVRQRFVDWYTASHSIIPSQDGRMILVIGPDAWPVPIPLEQVDGRWRFDASRGAQDIVDRRIGRNELMTIRTLLAAVAAQKDYFDRMQRGSGTGAYAQRMLSTPGKEDGLYWDVATGEAPSPLGPLIAQVESEGYPGATGPHGKPTPYQGYFYHLLKAQGPNAPGGAKNYVHNGSMTEGFAYVAWPAVYQASGIVTFLVDQDGTVFQKDLGRDTSSIAGGMTTFNPDFTWARVDISD
jgi:hypothetical protein